MSASEQIVPFTIMFPNIEPRFLQIYFSCLSVKAISQWTPHPAQFARLHPLDLLINLTFATENLDSAHQGNGEPCQLLPQHDRRRPGALRAFVSSQSQHLVGSKDRKVSLLN